ncbi:DUF3375 family protein [Jongsikchunia kroppenstedtii]|uniref:DUF3375 family protein n=1 Tax=Jongsikchunia kroppenstedtii TaxID=1121721 RepID=UPI00037D0D86|nr:DUF3375 family protein [Jongsikchunia kroppenstedtii]
MSPRSLPRNSAAQLYRAFSDNADGDVTLRLLRSRHAVVYLAMMAARLGDGQVAGDHLAAGLEQDLRALAEHWTTRGWEVPTPTELLDRWVKEGFCARTMAPGHVGGDADHEAQVERYQLTRGATRAIAQVQSVRQDRTVATETVVSMMLDRLSNIAVAISPDVAEHLRDIDEKIAELNRRREQLAAGALPTVDTREVLDDLRMVTSLAERMPADIIGYGEKMRENTRMLLTQGLDGSDGGYAEALNRMFDGHDALAESPEGRSFDGFYTLIADHRLRTQLEGHIAQIVSGIADLPDDLADTLTGFIDRMWHEVQLVDEVRGQVYRRINTFVKDGDVLNYRALRAQIADAQKAAVAAFEHAPAGTDMRIPVPMTAASSGSVGALSFHDGIVELPEAVEDTAGEFAIDPADLVGVESIDWQRLTDAVNRAIGSGAVDLAAALAEIDSPRAGDIIGVWSLAAKYGVVLEDSPKVAVWATTSRGVRQVMLPDCRFTEPIPGPTASAGRTAVHLFDDLEEVR